jgi:hypothetical protein
LQQVVAFNIPRDVTSSPKATAQLNWDENMQTHAFLIGDGEPIEIMPVAELGIGHRSRKLTYFVKTDGRNRSVFEALVDRSRLYKVVKNRNRLVLTFRVNVRCLCWMSVALLHCDYFTLCQ